MSTSMPVGQFEHQDLRVVQFRSGQWGAPVLFAAMVPKIPARLAIELINSWTITSEGGRHTGSALGRRRPGRTRSWLGPRLGFVEGLCDLQRSAAQGSIPTAHSSPGEDRSLRSRPKDEAPPGRTGIGGSSHIGTADRYGCRKG